MAPFGARAATWLFACVLLVACRATADSQAAPPVAAPPQVAPAALPSAATLDAATAAPALVLAEGQGAATRNLATLALLWADDAEIVETRNTPDPGDDYRWIGRNAILDRYQVAVFPIPPPLPTTPPAAAVEVDGETATLANGIDAWTFVRREGRWWIQRLVIGTP